MSLSLDERVKTFHDNPHPPQLVWLETAYLISDLWKEIQRMRKETAQTRTDAANVVCALDAAVQYAEALLTFLAEEGTPLHPNVVGAKHALDQALTVIGVRKP